VISGKVSSSESQINFTFPTDYLTGNLISYPVNILSDGTYHISLDIKEPLAGVLTIGDWKMPLFIHPNDTLSISLIQQGEGYTSSISGAFSIETELLSEIEQASISTEDLTYAMLSKDIDEYKPWLTERYNRLKATYLGYRSKHSLSPKFEVYLNSELDYSFAYYLLKYRLEYPVANNLVPPLELPSQYINSVNRVLINNEAAICSPAYRKFLDEYVDLSREVDEGDQLYLGEENFVVTSKTSPLFAQPDVPPIYQSIEQGEVVKFLGQRSDFKTKSRVGGEMSEDYWYKVKLGNGREGWLIGQTIEKVEKKNSQNLKPIQHEVSTKSKVVTRAKAIFDNLELFNDPHERKVIRTLGYGFEMDYPHVSTTENLAYRFQGIDRLGKFVMVDVDGQVGWVFEQGIKTERKVIESVEQRQVVTLAALKDYSYLDRLLIGTPLYYFIAADLVNRIQFDQDENLKLDIENFLSISDDEYINNFVQYYYNESYGTELDFGLSIQDVQLVGLIGTVNTEEVVSSTYVLDNAIEVFQNYVVLPAIEDPINLYETRISIPNSQEIKIQVNSDPLSGRSTILRGYRSDSKEPIAFDQSSNEFATIVVSGIKKPIFLKAGSDLGIKCSSDGDLVFESVGNENNFLNDFYNTFHKRDETISQRIRTENEIDFKTYISSLAKQKLTFLKAKETEYDLEESFTKDMTYDINYWLGYQLLRYTQEHAEYDKSWALPKENNEYYDFLKQIDINPVNRTLSNNYHRFIQSYFSYLHGQLAHRNKSAKPLIEEQFNGYSFYYLKALELYADVFKGDPIGTGKEIAQFVQINPYVALNKSLSDVYNANLPLRAGVPAPDFTLRDSKGRTVSKAQLKGKIVVLDFWATWCAPCLEKMRTDRGLWNKYNSDDVVFLYVSLDNNKSAWQRFLRNNPSIKGLHAFPKDRDIAFESSIAQSYKISSIPAFFIIGKDGNLAYNPFTTLSPGRIRDHIDNLLYPR